MVEIVQPDPFIRVRLEDNVHLEVRPYTADRLFVQVTRTQPAQVRVHGKTHNTAEPGKQDVVTYFHIGLDQLDEIRRVGERLISDKLGQLGHVV